MRAARSLSLALWAMNACAVSPAPVQPAPAQSAPLPPAPPPAPADKVLSVIGTNDLHGYVEHLGAFAGYVDRLRELRRSDGGVVLVDAGDMFQGTLESNLGEGAAVIAAYNALGYTAAALGNHDFDYGPLGDVEPATGVDPQGALRARLADARFPVLSANLIDTRTGRAPTWKNLHTSVLIEVAGVKLGIVGALTHETPTIVMPAYFAGLGVAPLAPAIAGEAASLRARGARVVLLVAHAGGVCKSFDDPRAESACNSDEEINRVARELPRGAVDAIIAGHSHHGVAHYFSGIAVAESFSYGRAFSRIDLVVPAAPNRAVQARVFPPRNVCLERSAARCDPGSYEGAPIQRSASIDAAVSSWREAAVKQRSERLGVQVKREIRRDHEVESPLGNLLSDLLLAAIPGADVAILNGGGLRASLPVGDLTYGQLYESQPFDNRVAKLRLTGAELRRVIAAHLERDRHGIISIAGARVGARCVRGRLEVTLKRKNTKAIGDADRVTVVTSDYLATGGDELFAGTGRPAVPSEQTSQTVRDALAAELRKRGGTLDGADSELHDAKRPRLDLPGPRPIRCAK